MCARCTNETARQGLAVFADDPALAAVRLECGHHFNAAALLYHWMCSRMRCPVCRSGADVRLAPDGLAGPWAAWCCARVADRLKSDALQELHDDERLVRQYTEAMQGMEVHAVLLNDFELVIEIAPPPIPISVHTFAYLYAEDTDGTARVARTVGLAHREDGAARHSDVRALNRAMDMVQPRLLSLCSIARRGGSEYSVVARTQPLSVYELVATVLYTDGETRGRYELDCTAGRLRGLRLVPP